MPIVDSIIAHFKKHSLDTQHACLLLDKTHAFNAFCFMALSSYFFAVILFHTPLWDILFFPPGQQQHELHAAFPRRKKTGMVLFYHHCRACPFLFGRKKVGRTGCSRVETDITPRVSPPARMAADAVGSLTWLKLSPHLYRP